MIVLDPILPIPVVVVGVVLLLGLTVRLYLMAGATVERWRNFVLLFFRVCGLLLLGALLLQPSRQEILPPPSSVRSTLVALDTSLSMKQRDADRAARLDAARSLLAEARVVAADGTAENPRLRLFEFGADAAAMPGSIFELAPKARTTRINTSVLSLVGAVASGEPANAIVLLTDGHDFELVNPARTGAAARARKLPIYAVAFGKQGNVRDVSTRITSFQPYCYVKQKARITAALRLIGCEFEDLQVQLLRHGQLVQTRKLNADESQERTVEFEITEPQVGQYEYEVRVLPLEKEVDANNNVAITYLNVIDQQIRVLFLEGDPYWDSTFLQRSLMRNDKFDVDALVSYGKERTRAFRKTETAAPFTLPENLDQLAKYDVVILGRNVDTVLSPEQRGLLDQFVMDRSGTIIFARGPAFGGVSVEGEVDPVLWGQPLGSRLRLDVTREGQALSAFRGLGEAAGGLDGLPDLIAGRTATNTRPLTSTLAHAVNADSAAPVPAIVHRRYGRGQVVSVGVEGLWRWNINPRVEGPNTPFDRFWDQLILWLLAGRDFIPTRQFSFRPNSANVLLGEKAHFRLSMRQRDATVKSVPLTLFLEDKETGRVNMTASPSDPDRLTAEYLPERVGRYRAVARYPDGTSQESRFIVFSENLEETEVATDVLGLRRLCESSGGRLIEPSELQRLLAELNHEQAELAPVTRVRPLWNKSWVFYLAGVLFGLDWFLRRRWGLC